MSMRGSILSVSDLLYADALLPQGFFSAWKPDSRS